MTFPDARPRCTLHGRRCPEGSHHTGDEFGWDDDYLTGRDLEQAELDDADAACGVRDL